jgi:glycosyltransferase involved in cell wall biosynthesis
VTVAPLRAGSGTRLKILEALAAGRPVVTTPVGHEGLATVPEEHVLVAPDAATFARCVVRLCRDVSLRRRLGSAGRALVEREYGWERAGELLATLYAELVHERDSVAP